MKIDVEMKQKLLNDLPVICCYDKGSLMDRQIKKYIKSLKEG